MRETCARVLAAALLTGAIATVVGMAAHLGTPSVADGPIAAQPSLPQHTVRLTVQPTPRRRASTRLAAAQTTYARPRPQAATRNLVVVHTPAARRAPAHRELAATTAPQPAAPAPTPAPAPPTPVPAQPAQQPLPAQDIQGDGHGHGHGHGNGHGEQDD